MRQAAATHKQRAVWERRLWKGMILTILIVGAFIMSLPFVWLVSSSFKLEEKIFVFPPEWIPNPFRPQNYVDALLYKPFGLYFFNTMRIVTLNLVAILLSASFCGYGFAPVSYTHLTLPTKRIV